LRSYLQNEILKYPSYALFHFFPFTEPIHDPDDGDNQNRRAEDDPPYKAEHSADDAECGVEHRPDQAGQGGSHDQAGKGDQ